MAVIDRQRISDGFVTLERGVDSGRSPNLLPRNQASFAVNVTMRGGYVKSRPGFDRIELTYTGDSSEEIEATRTRFLTGRFQGAYPYEYGNNSYIICGVGGYIYRIDTKTKEVMDITPKKGGVADPNLSTIPVFYFQQAEEFLIIQDGLSLPIIWAGAASRRSNLQESEVPVGKAMAYGNGRLWVSRGREFVAGDISGGPTSVIQFNENPYLSEGGAFSVPLDTGDITSMKFTAQPDSSLGQGELLVHTHRAVFAVNVPVDRDQWKNVQYPTFRIVAINYGSVSDRSCTVANGDMFYRAPDGIRSYVSSRREWQQYGQIPISREISPHLEGELLSGLPESTSSALFDNRLLFTVSPQTDAKRGTYFHALAPLDFDLVGGNGDKAPPAWEGLWTGLNFLQVMTLVDEGKERCFAFHLSETSGEGIQLWELSRNKKDDWAGPIDSYVETKSYSFENLFEMKKLESGELWIDELSGEVKFDIKYKPNQYPAWVDWDTFTECAKTENCDPPPGSCLTLKNYKPQFMTRRRVPQPADDCESSNGAPMRNAYEFSVRIGWQGQARIRGFRCHAYPVVEEGYSECLDGGSCV